MESNKDLLHKRNMLSKKTIGDLFVDFINNSFLVSNQRGCFSGIKKVNSLQMYFDNDCKVWIFHAECKPKEFKE